MNYDNMLVTGFIRKNTMTRHQNITDPKIEFKLHTYLPEALTKACFRYQDTHDHSLRTTKIDKKILIQFMTLKAHKTQIMLQIFV